MSPHLARAELLLNQSRFDLAVQELKLALADDPHDPLAHALLAHTLIGLQDLGPATEAAERAVAVGPDLPFTHYALAAARYQRNHYPEAENAIHEAIRLDPSAPDYYALLAAVFSEQEKWATALVVAEEGLALDPEHSACTNMRAMCLVKQGRREEAGAAMEGALARDPDDAFTHANRGWSLLHEGNPNKALEHFREALRLEPELDYARLGMIEALKAQYWLYRQILRYFLWLSRLCPMARWGVVIGLLVSQQVIAGIARANPALGPILNPILIAYLLFVITTWTAVPLTNLALRLNRFGRFALSRHERMASNWVAGFVVMALICVGYGICTSSPYDLPGWVGALTFIWILMPISATFACEAGWPRLVMAVYTTAMVIVAISGLWFFWSAFEIGERNPIAAKERIETGITLLRANMWAGLLSGFVANWLMNVRPRD
jgi:tetratricopeptide (TPR) repeat protein